VYGGRHKLADLVPVDMTANAMIAIAWHNTTHRSLISVIICYSNISYLFSLSLLIFVYFVFFVINHHLIIF